MKRLTIPCRLLLTGLMFAATAAYADGDVYICTGPGGVKEYKNTGETKGCSKANLPQLTVTTGASGRNSVVRSPAVATPPNFPKVDGDAQRARDSDRKQLLQTELQKERGRLEALQQAFNNGAPERQGNERNYAKYQERVAGMKDDIDRSQKNIEALQRELGKN